MNKVVIRQWWCLLCLGLACAWAAAQTPSMPAGPGVVVVLAGGGAKGFAHLAVLRRLERDGVKIDRLVGTSMGAVVGGLYASGMSTDDIERMIGNLDPAKVALDQIDRLELPLRLREYQRQYPIDLEFGLKDGQLSFARGVSDGQRFLALLQQLTVHLPPNVNFDQLRIPFRAVATRYRDGELTVFREGPLHLAIRASMAAPGVFAPVEVNGETYVDGGLVANLPIEVALQEGASVVVASYLGQEIEKNEAASGNALAVANRMLEILIRQNEKRNLALLREQDVLVQPQLKDVGFTDFRRASDIVAMGESAVSQQNDRFVQLAQRWGSHRSADAPVPGFDGREVLIEEVRVTGTTHTQNSFVAAGFKDLQGKPFSATLVGRVVDQLYTSGHFERVSYSLEHIRDSRYALVVDVHEKPYGPHYFKTSLGFSAERGGINQFSVGMGYRRPWLNASGLELALDAQAGTQTELGLKLYQPLRTGLGVQAYARYQSTLWPVYPPADVPALSQNKLAYALLSNQSVGADLTQDWGRGAVLRVGGVARQLDYQLDTAASVGIPLKDGTTYPLMLDDQRVRYAGWRVQWLVDKLDSVSFPEHGHYLNAVAEHGAVGTALRSYMLNARWAYPFRTHVINLGVNLGRTEVPSDCLGCRNATALYLGGFQNMGAYRMGQLVGDRLAHAYLTYMYRWSDGGLLRQKTFLGAVAEAGDVWFDGQPHATRYSGTLFVAVDSKLGDIYMGLARGSAGMTNAFVQLGRRFGW